MKFAWMTTAIASTAIAFTGLGATAQALTLNSTSGAWGIPTGGANINYQTVGAENQVRWGIDLGSGQSALGFTGVGASIFNIGDIFQVGSLQHYNNPTGGGSAISAVPLTVDLNFGDPALMTSFTFNFQVDETPNAAPCTYPSPVNNPCSDRISFESAFSPQVFTIDSVEYTLELLGFSNTPEGEILDGFISDEGGANRTNLYGRITATRPEEPPVDVPEPTALLGLSMLGLYLAARRQAGQAS